VSATPFHVATPGEISLRSPPGVSALASLAYSSTDGEIEFGAVTEPAASAGVVRLTYGRRGAIYGNTEGDDAAGHNAAGERRRECRRVNIDLDVGPIARADSHDHSSRIRPSDGEDVPRNCRSSGLPVIV